MKILKCDCGREQAYGRPNHITMKEAVSLGWVFKPENDKWICPICNPALAECDYEIVAQDKQGNKVSLGKYRTSIENYIVNVDVQSFDLSNCINLQIEFFGKVQL